MLRLLLGLVVAIVLLYGGLHLMGRRAQMAGVPATVEGVKGPAPVRKVVVDYRAIEAQNRAALDRTVQTADQR
jgi:hypothetical protein